MGCGPSQDLPPPDTCPGNNNKATPNGLVPKGNVRKESEPVQQLGADPKPQGHTVSSHKQVPKAVVFDIPNEDAEKVDIIKKHPPKRLQRLEPLESAPHMTAEMLEQKQRNAEQKRLQELERVKATSRKASRVQRDILMAKRFEEEQQRHRELEEKLKSAEKNRESKLKEIEDRKQLREERAQRIRAKAQRLQEEGAELDFEIEKDETFNADDDDDPWLNGGAKNTHMDTQSPPPQGSLEEDWERSDWEKSGDRTWVDASEGGTETRQGTPAHRVSVVNRGVDDDGFFD